MKKFFVLPILILSFSQQAYANITLQKLQVNYQTTPLGADIATPQFSWQMRATNQRRGYKQTAYQIIVTDEKARVVWDSKKVSSDLSHAIQYAGEALKPMTRYTWKVTVWDNFGHVASASSWFETGLMNTSVSAWSGAKWIGGGDDDLVLYAHYLSVYRFQYGIQLDRASGSTRAAFVFGANDPRLMNKYLNLMGQENHKDESYVAVELDISAVGDDPRGIAKLNLYRVGYTKDDKADAPFKSLEIPANVINNSNKYDRHQVYADCVFGQCEFYVNGADAAHRLRDSAAGNAPRNARGVNLNPAGRGGDYISFPMLSEIGFKVGANQVAWFSDLQIKNFRAPSNTLFAEDLNAGAYKGIFQSPSVSVENGCYRVVGNTLITANPSRNAAPMLRSVFNVAPKTIRKARLYVTARGIYEIHLNGQRVGNDYFNPGVTQYNRTHMYQTYDVTAALRTGQPNAIGAWLGEGWWSGNSTFSGDNWNFFGDRQSLLAKLVITYADGSEQVITSNDKDWKLFTDGPIRYGSFFQGEVYDANKEAAIKGWATAGYDDSAWQPAVEVPLANTTFAGVAGFGSQRIAMTYDDLKLVGQLGENATVVKTLTAQKVEEARPKIFVYDMGQNMVGVPQIPIRNGKKGQVITIRYAEMRYPNLPAYKGNEGMVMMENIRAALATDTYALKGGDEIIQPRFTFHGYRYLEITGIEQAIPANEVKGLVISSIRDLASHYETSDPLINRFWQNITWSLRGNFLSIPTDTPARNERLGWSGDIMVFSRSSTYLADVDLFLRRHLLAMRDTQSAEGRFADVAPTGFGFGGTLWGSAGIVVAWEAYRQFGDAQLLAEHYDAMKRYIQFLESKVDKTTGILNEGPLGDWLSPEGNKNDNTLFWMAYFAYDLEIVSRVAAILGKADEATKFQQRSQEIKKVFNEIYVDKTTRRTVKSGVRTGFMGPPNQQQGPPPSQKGQLIDTQASYAIPLALNVFNDENKPYAIKFLNETVRRKNKDDGGVERPEYSLMTGFIGTASISEALSANGSDDLAYRLLLQKEYPSWLYPVVNGATSIWERLNSYTIEDGFGGNNSMNSFNHYSFGAVAAWMYNYSLGIQRHPEKAGFKEFILRPTPDPNKLMTFAKGHYDSIYGRIVSEWRIEGDRLIYKATVPPNTTAKLYLPAKSADQILESGKPITNWQGVVAGADRVLIPLTSGSYSFEVRP
jgi:alpha-L-rhamnosidase